MAWVPDGDAVIVGAIMGPFVLGAIWAALEWWGSRGPASEEEIVRHRLKEHHGFDVDRRAGGERDARDLRDERDLRDGTQGQ